MYHTLQALAEQAVGRGCTIGALVLENEMALTGAPREEVCAELRRRWGIMEESTRRALEEPQQMVLGLIAGQSQKQSRYTQAGDTLCGPLLGRIMARALSACEVNASMGRICAAPTAGSCGILPAVLGEVAAARGAGEGAVLDALLTACGVGAVITKNATVAGAEGGCQAECGTAATMAAAAAVVLAGGSVQMVENAVAIALMNSMGLVCDPVAGLVQLPCSYRNASQAVNAVLSADLALAGQQSVIPADEVISAMYRVGRQLPPELRETAQGGIAATPTGRALHHRLTEKQA